MNNFQLRVPVVLIIFNRPEKTVQVFKKIREVQPSKLFVIADGPRISKIGEDKKCQECRDIIKKINWDCEVIEDYSYVNLGCQQRIISGLDRVFKNVEEAIILEDDCLPDKSFFYFCDQLLKKYQSNEKIMSISGTNLLYGTEKIEENNDDSYYFSRISGNWGWATWKRAWKKNDITMKAWPENKKNKLLNNLFEKRTVDFWEEIFQKAYDGKIKTAWDYQWYHSILENDGVCIMPHGNLISNIGFGVDATNTFDVSCQFAKMKIKKIREEETNIIKKIEINKEYDQLMNRYFYSAPDLRQKIKRKIRSVLKKVIKF